MEARGNVPIDSVLPTETPVATGQPDNQITSPTPSPTPTATEVPTVTPTTTPEATLTPTPLPDFYQFEGLSLRPGEEEVTLTITLPNSEETFPITASPVLNTEDNCDREGSFRPRLRTSCVFVYPSHGEDFDLAYYVHTGYNSETDTAHPAEPLRRRLEDVLTTYNVRVPAAEREARMAEVEGSLATLTRGEVTINDLQVLEIVRIPPERVNDFMRSAATNIFIASEIEPDIAHFINNGRREIFLIICGRRTDDEALPEGETLPEALWSRYIIVIGRPETPASMTP
jgi:hypothetical protein